MADNLSIPLNLYIKKLRMLGLGWPYQDIHVLSWLADWLVSGPGMLSGCHHIPGSRVCRRWQVLIRPRLQTAECQETYADLITVHCGNAAKLANRDTAPAHNENGRIFTNRDIAQWEYMRKWVFFGMKWCYPDTSRHFVSIISIPVWCQTSSQYHQYLSCYQNRTKSKEVF